MDLDSTGDIPGTPATGAPGPLRLEAHSTEDVLAVVPVILGFVPQDSIVMLTFGGENTFHARIDLPAAEADRTEVLDTARALSGPAAAQGVGEVLLVLYCTDAARAERSWRTLRRELLAAGVRVGSGIRADGRCWFLLGDDGDDRRGRRRPPTVGVPYDLASHRFAAQAVFAGRVTHASRADLAATLVGRASDVGGVERALEQGAVPDQPAAEAAWLRATVRRLVGGGCRASDAEAARVLGLLGRVELRDVCWAEVDRLCAHQHVELWTDLVRRSPGPLRAEPAALLAFAAWLAGHGALAWCAVDRCRETSPDHSLAGIVAGLLEGAVPPTAWDHDPGWADRLLGPGAGESGTGPA